MGKREHSLRFEVGGEVHEGTLAQVQAELDARLRCTSLGRVAFFGQHLGGGAPSLPSHAPLSTACLF